MKTIPKTEKRSVHYYSQISECLKTKIETFQREFAIFKKPESENCPGGWQAALAAGPGLAYPWQLAGTAGQQATNPASRFDENGTGTKTVPKPTKKTVEERTFPAGSNKKQFS